jgi:hypothetical protein
MPQLSGPIPIKKLDSTDTTLGLNDPNPYLSSADVQSEHSVTNGK